MPFFGANEIPKYDLKRPFAYSEKGRYLESKMHIFEEKKVSVRIYIISDLESAK